MTYARSEYDPSTGKILTETVTGQFFTANQVVIENPIFFDDCVEGDLVTKQMKLPHLFTLSRDDEGFLNTRGNRVRRGKLAVVSRHGIRYTR